MGQSSGSQNFFRAVHERKLWSLIATYLIVGLGLIEGVDILGPRFELPEHSVGYVLAFLLFGFPLALLIQWFVMGREIPGVARPVIPLLTFLLIGTVCSWLGSRALSAPKSEQVVTVNELPLVVLMDSHHPARVYDDETIEKNATNADVLSDVLLDLPIRRQRESVSPSWHRDEEILRFQPTLIIIHYSAFRLDDSSGIRERLRLFINYFADSDTEFLIYSRASEIWLQEKMDGLLAETYTNSPDLKERVHVFGLTDYGPSSWLSPLTTGPLKLRVKKILSIP